MKGRLVKVADLIPSERRFVFAMRELRFGRFESIAIQSGELVLEPWPVTVQSVKFGCSAATQPDQRGEDFELKKQISELFAFVREMKRGQIRVLEIRGGLPFCMEIELCS